MQKLSIIVMNLTLIKMIFKKVGKFGEKIIGKNTNTSERKMSFSINDVIVTDNRIIANEFNNFLVSIGKKLSK